MINIQRILCPTDLSMESDEALRYALALASAYKAKLILFYCRRPSSVSEWVNSARAEDQFKQSLFTHLDADDLMALEWEGVVAESDDVGLAIGKAAAEKSADLIVMRSRRRPLAALLVGSTAETVSRISPCPVLVVHPHEREWVGLSTNEIDLHRVLVAYDFSADSKLALSYGISLAQEHQTEVHLLHIIGEESKDEPQVAWTEVGVESLYKDVAARLQQAVPKEAFLWCNVVNAVRSGRPADEILAYAKEKEIDIVCMGASGSGFRLGTLLGSTVDRVLRRAPCPVLVARPMDTVAPADVRQLHKASAAQIQNQRSD